MSSDNQSLAHTSWNCKCHIVFAPKYRRKEFYGLKRLQIGAILRTLCEWKQITIHEGEVCPNHVHQLVSGALRRHGGEEHEEDRRIHSTPARRRQGRRAADDRLRRGPV